MQSSFTPLKLTRRAFLVRGLATAAAAATLAVPTAALPTVTRAAPSRQQLPTLVMALDQSDVRTLDPAREFEFAAAFIDLNCYDTLVQYNQDDFTRFEPALAKEWTISPDGTEYTFKLREDVKFASGNPLTAEDVVFSINRWKNIKGNPAWMTDSMAEIKALDQYTVVTRLKEPFADWLAVVSGPNASIVDMKLATEHGASAAEDAGKSDTAEEWFNQNSVGSGPFILRGWEKNNVIRLEANPNYWRGAPRIGAVEVRDVPSPAAQKL